MLKTRVRVQSDIHRWGREEKAGCREVEQERILKKHTKKEVALDNGNRVSETG